MAANSAASPGSRWPMAQSCEAFGGPTGRTEPKNRVAKCHNEPNPWALRI